MKLLTPCHQVFQPRRVNRRMAARSPAVNLAAQGPHVPIKKEKKREADKERGIIPNGRDAEEDGVIGEVEQPAPPSEKPEAP